jgi:hypothetical protein
MSNNLENIKSLAIDNMNVAMKDEVQYALLKTVFETVQNREHWKFGTYFRQPMPFEEAITAFAALAFYHGGAEVSQIEVEGSPEYVVSSLGYYHYCGA